MSQPPNDPFYNAPTQNAGFSQLGPGPNYSPQSGYQQSGYPPAQGPMSQPGFPPPSGSYPQQGAAPNYPPAQGPMSQPGFPPPGGFPQQGSAPNYPPAQGPMSQPGFPQQGSAPTYPSQQPSWPGSFPPPQGPASYPGLPGQQGFPPPAGGYPQGQDQYGSPPSWPNLTQPPEGPRKSKKGLITIISIVVVLVLILGGIGAAFALRSRGTTANAPTPTAQNTPATNGVTPAATTPAANTTPSTGTSGQLNQPIQAGNWVVTVTHVTATTVSALPPKPGDAYLEITLTLKNTSATTQLVSSLLQFSLTDANGGKYDEALTDTNIHRTPDGNVNAGQTLNAQIAYEVPQTQHNFVLSFEYNLINGSNATVTWQLSA
jgi:flagellar basal body-associated protein FliL